MSKFTPGPWTSDGCYLRGADGEQDIARIYQPMGMPDEERSANARIIAAAPEMYELLRGICEQRSHCFIPNDKDDLFCFDDKLVTLLAKIDGGA